jgi:2-dehydro-3-deoxygluconokinase
MLQGGVDLSHLVWMPYDGVGRDVRNGLNFTERGFGPRAGVGCSDRGNTAISQLKVGDVDFAALFQEGARWLHTGGVYCALSESSTLVAQDAVRQAHQAGTAVSYDLNYRDSLWRAIGGQEKAREVNQKIAPMLDVLFGNEEDFSAALGFELDDVDDGFSELPIESYKQLLSRVAERYPNLTSIAVTLRTAHSASVNGWGALCLHEDQFYHVPQRQVELMDRVGGGDSFASGFIYGLLADKGPQWALECGVAHGALAMSTPGDTTMASLKEVERAMKGAGARIER